MTIQLDYEDEQPEEDVLSQFPDHELLTITRVERQQKSDHRYIIHFGTFSLNVHEDIMIKYRMISENAFTKEDLQQIVLADERQRAYVEGLRYLERKPRTGMEMARRLRQKEIGEAIITEVLERLRRERLIDDTQYAKQWAEQRITGHRKGRLWVRHELRGKGIDKSVIADALDGISTEQERQSALELGRKKWNTIKGETSDKRRKTGAFLMRRGFSGEIVRSVLNSLWQDADMDGAEDDFCEFD
ncbi:regulatory protein [Paenibacillus sophorae]|uniref:Regulatory protein RecX n=1 Tax=Paenibacillus sophorae TaxID=1333845 RepID=A0A1H8G518_9BACL|nr:RecX family transcriptional regulator [Paenibacillus sophorae]QWU14100.1 RecX family transcriptional regulator [Paenibacillus sophorae]SEN39116.1 regulatory protein [Paenibacillus sophorae]